MTVGFRKLQINHPLLSVLLGVDLNKTDEPKFRNNVCIFFHAIGLLRNLVAVKKGSDYKANLIGRHSNLVPKDLT